MAEFFGRKNIVGSTLRACAPGSTRQRSQPQQATNLRLGFTRKDGKHGKDFDCKRVCLLGLNVDEFISDASSCLAFSIGA